MAHSVGASRAAVSLWEAGRRMPRGDAALRYARLLTDLDNATRATDLESA